MRYTLNGTTNSNTFMKKYMHIQSYIAFMIHLWDGRSVTARALILTSKYELTTKTTYLNALNKTATIIMILYALSIYNDVIIYVFVFF